MKSINNDNIDELMFQLLEGEITGEERAHLLQAIHADQAYLKAWKVWQNTVLKPEEIIYNTTALKRKKTFVIPYYLKYAVAAILILGLVILLNDDDKSSNELALLPPKIRTFKNPLPQPQKDTSSYNRYVRDTFVPLKEKVRFLAHQTYPSREIYKNQIERDTLQLISQSPQQINLIEKLQIIAPVALDPEIPQNYQEEIFVTVSSENNTESKIEIKQSSSFLNRLIGKSSIKIEPDEHTKTKRKIIFESKKYQIIAGF